MIASEEKTEKARSEIKKSINSITFGFVLGFVLTLSEIYKTFTQGAGSTAQIVSLVIGFTAGVMLLFVPVMLKKESKHALTLLLLGLALAWSRWFFVEGGFDLNVVSMIVLLILGWFIARMVKWIRVGALR